MIVPPPDAYLKTFALTFVAGFISAGVLHVYTKWMIKQSRDSDQRP